MDRARQRGTRCGYVPRAQSRCRGEALDRVRALDAPPLPRGCLPVIILAPTGRCIEITQEREQNCWAREARRRGGGAKLGPEIPAPRARYWMRGPGVGAQDLLEAVRRQGPPRRRAGPPPRTILTGGHAVGPQLLVGRLKQPPSAPRRASRAGTRASRHQGGRPRRPPDADEWST